MDLKGKMNLQEPVTGEAETVVDLKHDQVFDFIATNFHQNYQKWMPDVVNVEFLDGVPVHKGSRVKQVKSENDENVTSTFEITEFSKADKFSFEGRDSPYRQIYSIAPLGPKKTSLSFRFELLEVDLFMRPFVKLIRASILEGVESTTEALYALLNHKANK